MTALWKRDKQLSRYIFRRRYVYDAPPGWIMYIPVWLVDTTVTQGAVE